AKPAPHYTRTYGGEAEEQCPARPHRHPLLDKFGVEPRTGLPALHTLNAKFSCMDPVCAPARTGFFAAYSPGNAPYRSSRRTAAVMSSGRPDWLARARAVSTRSWAIRSGVSVPAAGRSSCWGG